MRAFLGGFARHALACGYDRGNSFAQSLSNFTFQLWMMRGGTLLIFVDGVKGQEQDKSAICQSSNHQSTKVSI